MPFIDELHLHLTAGRGGDGVVRWLHLKGKDLSGAAGGNGGRGGDVVVTAIRDITVLLRYNDQKSYEAEDGAPGGSQSKEGRDGKELLFEFPIGTVITNVQTGQRFELLTEGQREIILQGGNGGYGNEHFKGSRNVTPKQSTKGKPGEEADFDIELQLVVDAGLIGLPNAGKSSVLNALTGAHAKVGDYAFTTLNPNLGALYGFVLADIPGLIEGAAEGRGLGHTFLRHIKRTKTLIHCISCEHENPVEAFTTIRTELSKYSSDLAEKPELILFTKRDLVDEKMLTTRIKEFAKATKIPVKSIISVSVYDDPSLKGLGDTIVKALRKK